MFRALTETRTRADATEPTLRLPAQPTTDAGSRADGLRTSSAARDTRWDEFLAGIPRANHTQTSLWSRVKSTMGWRPVRVLAERGGQIVGGVQILYRRIPVVGSIGYISGGPVLARHDPALAARIMDEVEATGRRLGMRALAVQPPGAGDTWPAHLGDRGYVRTDVAINPRATIVLDVSRPPDEIMATMASKTRYNIRLSARRSVVVRDGDVDDLDTYYELLRSTADRQGFTPFPKAYFAAMWDTLTPGGHLRLSLAEVDGRAVSGQLAVIFGDTVVNKLSVWSGEAGSHRPNEALQWATIRWAHEHGRRYYDLEGMDLPAARAVIRGEPLPSSAGQTVTSFKLGFGGDVVLRPEVRMCIRSTSLRWGFAMLYPRFGRLKSIKRIIRRARTRNSRVLDGTGAR